MEPLLSCPCCVFGVIVMLKDPATTHLQCSYWGKEVVGQNLLHGMAPTILPSIRCSRPVLFVVKHPQSMMFPPPCFTVDMVFLGLYSSFFLQTRRVEFIPKSYILVSSDHMTFSHASSGSSRWSLALFRWAWTCAGLSRGTLRALQDFNPWRCNVLLMVTVETVVPSLFRSLTRSSRVVLGWYLTFPRIIDTPRGEILHGAPVRGRLTVILNFFHFFIIVPTVVAFSPSYLPIVL